MTEDDSVVFDNEDHTLNSEHSSDEESEMLNEELNKSLRIRNEPLPLLSQINKKKIKKFVDWSKYQELQNQLYRLKLHLKYSCKLMLKLVSNILFLEREGEKKGRLVGKKGKN